MLGGHYFLAQTVRTNTDRSITLVVLPLSGEEEADLANLRPGPFGGGSTLPFAWNNDAGTIRIKDVQSEMVGNDHAWTITLTPVSSGSGNYFGEVSLNTGNRAYSADEIAKLRAARILINDPPLKSDQQMRTYDQDSFLESHIRGIGGHCEVRESPIRAVYAQYSRSPNWKEYARLQAVYMLKTSGTVDHILELTFGNVRSGKLPVKFRGRRERRGSGESTLIEITGLCPLS
jgi:hypothetical protein